MVDKNRLTSHIKLHGETQSILAQALGISLNSLNGKINGDTEFKPSEITAICDRYHLCVNEMKLTFFVPEG